MPTVIFISSALTGQTQPPTTPAASRFIPGELAVPKTAGHESTDGPFTRKEIPGEGVFF
jgi:hypothetical protein